MKQLGIVLGTLGLLSVLPLLWRVRPEVRGTTLVTAWNWAVAGLLLWTVAWFTALVIPLLSEGLADQLWYGVALVVLCALVAVLGAKRPGSRVWGWFVLLPLFLVLGWPALFAWWEAGDGELERLVLLGPALAAFGLVCLMGVGNYFGTRFSISALLIGVALLALVAPLSTLRLAWLPAADTGRIWATLFLTGAAWLPVLQAAPDLSRRPALDRVWVDFRDAFGIVWARRIQDRFNDTAEKSRWPFRLGLDGLHELPEPAGGPFNEEAAVRAEMQRTLRWLLRRFVDPEWIDRRLHKP